MKAARFVYCIAVICWGLSTLCHASSDDDLVMAARAGDVAAVKHLLDKGANIEARWVGRSSLTAAAENGHCQVIKLLLGKGAQVDGRDNSGKTGLVLAAANGHLRAVELFLEAGADITARDSQSQNALILSAEGGHSKVVQLLLQKGANPSVTGGVLNKSAIEMAMEKGHSEVVEMLKAAGAKVADSQPQPPSPAQIALLRRLLGGNRDEKTSQIHEFADKLVTSGEAPFQYFRALRYKRPDGSIAYWLMIHYWDSETYGDEEGLFTTVVCAFGAAAQAGIVPDRLLLIPASDSASWRALIEIKSAEVPFMRHYLERFFFQTTKTMSAEDLNRHKTWIHSWKVLPLEPTWKGYHRLLARLYKSKQ